MQNADRYLLFTVDAQVLAVNIAGIERIIHAIETTNLPDAPQNITGIINFQNEIIPVLSLRKQFGLPEKKADTSEDFIIVKTTERTVVLVADAVSQVVEISPQDIVPAASVLTKVEYVKGFGKCEEGIILILDLEKLIALDTATQLTASINNLIEK